MTRDAHPHDALDCGDTADQRRFFRLMLWGYVTLLPLPAMVIIAAFRIVPLAS